MRVVRLKRGTHWTICAICESDDSCPVLDFIAKLDKKRRSRVLADLQNLLADNPSKTWVALERSKDLGDGWYEFRWGGKGGVPRIVWFHDGNSVVMCAHGVLKKQAKIPPREMAVAADRRTRYLAAKEKGELGECIEFENNENIDGN
jgi:phage-related protein